MEELTLAGMDGGSLPSVLMELVLNGCAACEWLKKIHSRPAQPPSHDMTPSSRTRAGFCHVFDRGSFYTVACMLNERQLAGVGTVFQPPRR